MAASQVFDETTRNSENRFYLQWVSDDNRLLAAPDRPAADCGVACPASLIRNQSLFCPIPTNSRSSEARVVETTGTTKNKASHSSRRCSGDSLSC